MIIIIYVLIQSFIKRHHGRRLGAEFGGTEKNFLDKIFFKSWVVPHLKFWGDRPPVPLSLRP